MKNHSNLIPSHTRRHAMLVHLVRRWLITCALILIVTSGACMVWRSDSLTIQRQLNGLNKQSQDVETQLANANRLHQRRNKLHGELNRLASLSNVRVPRAVFGLFCTSTSDLPERIRLEEFSMREMPVITTDKDTFQGFQIQVAGSANDDAAIQQFVDSLRQTRLFNSVELRSTQGVSTSNGESRQFQVHCQLVVDVADRYAEPAIAQVPESSTNVPVVDHRQLRLQTNHLRCPGATP